MVHDPRSGPDLSRHGNGVDPRATRHAGQWGNSYYDDFTIRGFDSTSIYRNNLLTKNFSHRETANLQSIEVLKGPAAMLFGRLEPGGIVNMVLKLDRRPRRDGVRGRDRGLDAGDRIIYDAATGSTDFDADGTGASGMILFAHVTPGLALVNTSFVVE